MAIPSNIHDRELQKFIENAEDGGVDVRVSVLNNLNLPLPANYDDIVLSYTSGKLTGVVYKLATVTLVTLTLSYTGDDLTRVQYA